MNKQKSSIISVFRHCTHILAIVLFFSPETIIGCLTTLFNDSKLTVKVIDHTDKSNNQHPHQAPINILFIPRNQSIRFGKPDEHAHFTIYTKVPNSHTFTATYEVKQMECGLQGSPYLKMSDIKNKTGDASLYTITHLQSGYSSMTQEITSSLQKPDIFYQEQSSQCSACSH
jgi:hypothetical protein